MMIFKSLEKRHKINPIIIIVSSLKKVKQIPKILFFLLILTNNSYAKKCTGRFVNPISDICWHCILPITIGAIPVARGETPDATNPSSPICICPAPPPVFQRVGLTIGYWEPVKMVDVTKEPFCFVGIGGMKIDPKLPVGSGGDPEVGADTELNPATWHVHWYDYPVAALLDMLLDQICMSKGSDINVTYMSELDPLWVDDELSLIINPEAILFGNLIAQAACSADCLASSFMTSLDPLFWCSGCQGSMYPMNGKVITHNTSIQSSLLVASRMIFKMHRQTLLPITSGAEALCKEIPSPMIKKSQYRMQLAAPVAVVDPIQGCNPLGRSTFFWESLKEIPVKGEDFNYVIFRKRNCCAI